MFGRDRIRLLRDECTRYVKTLAEELYAMFNPDNPLFHNNTVNVTINNTEAPGIVIETPGGGPAIDIPLPENPSTSDVVEIHLGDVIIGSGIDEDGNPYIDFGDAILRSRGGGGNAGTVVSGGPGAGPYEVLLVDGETVEANVMQINADQTVPEGTGVIVAQVGDDYYIQPPVWL
jgi:hypothetical protein